MFHRSSLPHSFELTTTDGNWLAKANETSTNEQINRIKSIQHDAEVQKALIAKPITVLRSWIEINVKIGDIKVTLNSNLLIQIDKLSNCFNLFLLCCQSIARLVIIIFELHNNIIGKVRREAVVDDDEKRYQLMLINRIVIKIITMRMNYHIIMQMILFFCQLFVALTTEWKFSMIALCEPINISW